MLDAETVLEKARALEPHIVWEDLGPLDSQIWKGTGHRARFVLSREISFLGEATEATEMIWLELRGSKKGQEA